MVCFDQGCAHVVAVTARTRLSGCVGRERWWRQAGRAIATRSGLLMSGEKSMPTRELLHLDAEVAACEDGAYGGLEKRRGKCVGRSGPVRAICLGPPLDTVLVRTTASELGLGNGGRRRRAARKQVQRLAVRTRSRRGQRGERVFAGVSGRQRATKQHRVALCSGQETARCGRQSACRVSTTAILWCCW